MQPAEAESDPAEWAEGQLQPSTQAAESHGSAPSATAQSADADIADSAAAGSAGSPGSSSAPEGAGPQGDSLQNMQIEPADELESSMLDRGNKLVLMLVLCCHVGVCMPFWLMLPVSCTDLEAGRQG